jgi:hypothetical protein
LKWSLKPRAAAKHSEWLEKLHAEGRIKNKPEALQERPPPLYPDMLWVWQAYCFLSERRGVGPNGPVSITAQDMLAYAELTGRNETVYRDQLVRFIPPLDRFYLKDFYERQKAEMEKLQKRSASRSRR